MATQKLSVLIATLLAVVALLFYLADQDGPVETVVGGSSESQKGWGRLQIKILEARAYGEDADENKAQVAEEVAQLIEDGADVNYQYQERGAYSLGRGMTPLHIAVLVNSPEIIEVLLDAGARTDIKAVDVDTQDDDVNDLTPVAYAHYLQDKHDDIDFSKSIRALKKR